MCAFALYLSLLNPQSLILMLGGQHMHYLGIVEHTHVVIFWHFLFDRSGIFLFSLSFLCLQHVSELFSRLSQATRLKNFKTRRVWWNKGGRPICSNIWFLYGCPMSICVLFFLLLVINSDTTVSVDCFGPTFQPDVRLTCNLFCPLFDLWHIDIGFRLPCPFLVVAKRWRSFTDKRGSFKD